MARPLRLLSALPFFLLHQSIAQAHFNMLLPECHSTEKGKEMTFTYQWGHPFEHQLFDAPKPASVFVLSPDGKRTDLVNKLEKASVAVGDKKQATVFRFRFTPEERGDYIFVLTTPPIWMEEEQEFLQDTVRVVLHVQAQKGWDGSSEETFEMLPLTRPYGLHAGMVFQAQAVRIATKSDSERTSSRSKGPGGLPGLLVEIERYNATPPKDLPPDEHITGAAKTDPNGVVTCTLTEPGWWCIAAQREGEKMERDGKTYPVRQRAIHWVYVDEKAAAKK
jgi:cobalt/nickel transport protein